METLAIDILKQILREMKLHTLLLQKISENIGTKK